MSAADPQVERLFSEQPHRIGREDQEAAIQNRPTEWAQTDDAGDLATCVVGVTFNHQPQTLELYPNLNLHRSYRDMAGWHLTSITPARRDNALPTPKFKVTALNSDRIQQKSLLGNGLPCILSSI
jgi:hypothetical protein